ncbi:MAG: ABC transporter permease [Candidatus Pacebacteria bacterium]|nr:ABC transporter permease [Candidatus Paceibacterota bacterium]
MQLKHLYKTSFTGLRTNKVRSLLTILGIVIGISSIILIFSLGKGVEGLITGELSGMGADTIVIRPGQQPTGLNDFSETLFSDSLKSRDVEALKKRSNVPHLAKIAPAIIVPGRVSYRGETFKPMIFGWTAELMTEMFGVEIESGDLFYESDIRSKASVAIIGSKVKEELFGNEENVVGKNIKIKDRNFRVVGVLKPQGQVSSFNVDELVVLPYSTAQIYLMGIDHYHEIILKADAPENVSQTVEDIKDTLREMHDISDPTKDDFFVVTPEGMLEQIGNILDALTLFLSAVVGIALVVGGVGVMNIMLVSVTERTKEIGLRKAIGATNKDIMIQFLFESMMLTITGGVIGIVIGMSLSLITTIAILSFTTYAWSFSFPIGASILGIVVSGMIGIIFGIYPAKKASQKSPIEALRYE